MNIYIYIIYKLQTYVPVWDEAQQTQMAKITDELVTMFHAGPGHIQHSSIFHSEVPTQRVCEPRL